jgi:hypothetical protein
MADIFGTQSKLGGTFKGTAFAMAVGGGGGDFRGAMVQQLQITYARQLERRWELGSTDCYFIEGHTEGQGSLQRIVGPKGLVDPMIKALANVCDAANRAMTLTAAQNTCGNGAASGTLTLESPVATRVMFGANVGNFIIDNSFELMFTSLAA